MFRAVARAAVRGRAVPLRRRMVHTNPAALYNLAKFVVGVSALIGAAAYFARGSKLLNQPFSGPTDVLGKPGTGEAEEDEEEEETEEEETEEATPETSEAEISEEGSDELAETAELDPTPSETSETSSETSETSETPETPSETSSEDDHPVDPSQSAYNPETGEINWDCPCLGGMAHGPCGEEFKEAFSCFVYTTVEPKGIECVDKFKGMQDCFRRHPEVYAEHLEQEARADEILSEEDRLEREQLAAQIAAETAALKEEVAAISEEIARQEGSAVVEAVEVLPTGDVIDVVEVVESE